MSLNLVRMQSALFKVKSVKATSLAALQQLYDSGCVSATALVQWSEDKKDKTRIIIFQSNYIHASTFSWSCLFVNFLCAAGKMQLLLAISKLLAKAVEAIKVVEVAIEDGSDDEDETAYIPNNANYE